MGSLYHQLKLGKHICAVTQNTYISLATIYSTITLDKVKEELPYHWRDHLFWSDILERKIGEARKVIALFIYTGDKDCLRALLRDDDLNDEDLPLSLQDEDNSHGIIVRSNTRDKTFNTFASWNHGKIHNILEKQWLVLAPTVNFTGHEAQEILLDAKCALPFDCKEINSTEFSKVYKGVVEQGHQSKFSQDQNNTRTTKDVIAVKKICKAENFAKEVENLKKLEQIDNPHLIKHLAICRQASCIIFPWANGGNLDQLWERESPTHQDWEVFMWSLKQMVGLASALQCLHDDGINCRHGDLKPANILNFTDGDGFGTLKIADVGVSRVHVYSTGLRHSATDTKASTPVYEAPEANPFRPDTHEPRSRTYDSWSMGCIMLEFIVWLLHGFQALEDFKRARGSEDKSFYNLVYPYGGSNQRTAQRDPAVDMVIKQVRKDKRCIGTALEEIVDMVDKHLLVIKAADRKKAVDIHESLKMIVDQVENGQVELVKFTADFHAITFS